VTTDELDGVTLEVSAHRVRHGLDHLGRAGPELRHRGLGIERETQPVDLAPTETGDLKGRRPQCLLGISAFLTTSPPGEGDRSTTATRLPK
jgi:hypothetical protein